MFLSKTEDFHKSIWDLYESENALLEDSQAHQTSIVQLGSVIRKAWIIAVVVRASQRSWFEPMEVSGSQMQRTVSDFLLQLYLPCVVKRLAIWHPPTSGDSMPTQGQVDGGVTHARRVDGWLETPAGSLPRNDWVTHNTVWQTTMEQCLTGFTVELILSQRQFRSFQL